jgi:hypothetical protein
MFLYLPGICLLRWTMVDLPEHFFTSLLSGTNVSKQGMARHGFTYVFVRTDKDEYKDEYVCENHYKNRSEILGRLK